jgi:hypothetical protein
MPTCLKVKAVFTVAMFACMLTLALKVVMYLKVTQFCKLLLKLIKSKISQKNVVFQNNTILSH